MKIIFGISLQFLHIKFICKKNDLCLTVYIHCIVYLFHSTFQHIYVNVCRHYIIATRHLLSFCHCLDIYCLLNVSSPTNSFNVILCHLIGIESPRWNPLIHKFLFCLQIGISLFPRKTVLSQKKLVTLRYIVQADNLATLFLSDFIKYQSYG